MCNVHKTSHLCNYFNGIPNIKMYSRMDYLGSCIVELQATPSHILHFNAIIVCPFIYI